MLLDRTRETLARKLKLRNYRTVRAAFENLSEAELADMGIKRYQLGAAARKSALR
jgi:uncharacterized protein YjiS (DUF1127 family)